jgi:single-stranded DNA-binding protein
MGDVNELSISGDVEHEPVCHEDDDHRRVCEFVLTHTTTSLSRQCERQRYNVQAYGELGEYYAATWQPGQAIVIDGRLEHHLCDTLAGPLPSIAIVAHCIDTKLGPHPHQPTTIA